MRTFFVKQNKLINNFIKYNVSSEIVCKLSIKNTLLMRQYTCIIFFCQTEHFASFMIYLIIIVLFTNHIHICTFVITRLNQ